MIKGKVVRELRKQLKLTQEDVARGVGLTYKRVSQIERSEESETTKFDRFVEVLKTKPYILRGESPPEDETEEETVNVPVYGYVPCGTLFPSDEYREGYYKIARVHIGHSKPDNLFAVKASGNSLIGDGITDGDYLVVDKKADFVNGKIYIVTVENETAAKHCYWENNRMKLVSTDGTYQDMMVKEVGIQGRVILSGGWRKH